MFLSEAINVPVLGIIETWLILRQKNYLTSITFWKRRSKNLAEDLGGPILRGIPIVQSIREAGDYGRPAAMQTASAVENIFDEVTVMLYKKR
jgi:ATP-binding protein involved in chromosome partitioning